MPGPDLAKILIVDDRPQNLVAIESQLETLPVALWTATSGNEALSLTLKHEFALVLLDVQMPEMDGFETAEIMRSHQATCHLPIIFLTAIHKENQHVFRGYEAGAVDYLFKPLDPDLLKRKILVFLELYQQKTNLSKSNRDLQQMILALEKANQTILAQQKTVIEEERLKVLLEMAGATAHELNQPLMALLGNIQLLEMAQAEAEDGGPYISKIRDAGQRIANITRKIQTLRHDRVKHHDRQTQMINIHQSATIMYMEDNPHDFKQVRRLLAHRTDIELHHVTTISEGLARLTDPTTPATDILFLDFLFENGNAFDVMEKLEKQGQDLPVVILTGQGDEMIASQLIQAGAYDYLTKSRLTSEALERIISQTLEKSRLKNDLKRMQAKLVQTAIKDDLTGLYNRRFFLESLQTELERADRNHNPLSLLMIDIDHFKSVNDQAGHAAGDAVLVELSRLLTTCLRAGDLAGRYGGEEFTVLLPETASPEARQAAEKIRQRVATAGFAPARISQRVTISIGLATKPAGAATTASDLLETADQALYRAKQNGRNQVALAGDSDPASR